MDLSIVNKSILQEPDCELYMCPEP